MNQMKEAIERGLRAMGATPKEKDAIREMVKDVLDVDGNINVVDMDARRKMKDAKTDMHFRNKERF
jgi:hypothetical protein